MLSRSGSSFIIEITKGKLTVVPEDKREIKVEVLDMMDGMAFVKATSFESTNYFQIQLIEDSWKIMNILNVRNQY